MSLTLADQTLARPDLADRLLEGQVRARRFEAPRLMVCDRPMADVRAAPDEAASRLDQLLFGEMFRVLEQADGWAWGQAGRDGQIGFVRLAELLTPGAPPTRRVAAAWAEVAGRRLPLNALVTAEAAGDLADLHTFDATTADAAERLVGAPYAEGGRTAEGMDAWGLVRQCLFAAGRGAPAVNEDDAIEIGRRLEGAEAPARGDIVLSADGPAIVLGPDAMVRARPGAGVVREPLDGGLYFRP